MPTILRFILYPLVLIVGFLAIAVAMVVVVLSLTYPNLPSLEILTDYRPKIPLQIFTADGYLLGEFGEERRALVNIQDVPSAMKQAILAAEDERFYQHRGIDTMGILRALYANLTGGGKRQGASTITQQVAKNFFLSSEKTYTRKLYEVLLSFKIESNLSKDQILELYINQIYLGQHAYGFAAASHTYFGKPLNELSLAEIAMLAGLPKAPSANNPVVNPKRARVRQQYVLHRMLELGFVTQKEYDLALAQPLVIKRDIDQAPVHAEFVTEMARQLAAEMFPDDVYTRGLRVYTTIRLADQQAAYTSVRNGLLEYDRRHGYRGAEGYVELQDIKSEQDEAIDDLFQEYPDLEDMHPAIVFQADNRKVRAVRRGGEVITITGDGLRFAARMLDDKSPPGKRITRGAVIRVQSDERNNWRIVQLPEAEAAFLAADPRDGAIRALVGGFDFNRNQFNHVTQAWRQPGSSFKPFIYSAALEKGFTPASIINDEPISFPSTVTGSQVWEPKNYDGRYEGPMRMRTALAKSKNMVSIRLLQASGVHFVQDYVTRFGFEASKHPPYLTMALGAGSVTPWQMVSAYAIFANGGYRIRPYIVSEIQDDKKAVLARMEATQAGDESLRAIDARNAYLMDSMMRDVTIYGTAARAATALKRKDLAGKTGTTNEHVDAWFCGYQQTIVGCSWIGFDQPKNLGKGETGGTAALPTWISFMSRALKDVPEAFLPAPEGLVVRRSNRNKTPSQELFYEENAPNEGDSGLDIPEEDNSVAPED